MNEEAPQWFLRHRDGIEHGPFQLADLVAAATAGNIADDTQVRHPRHTRGAWILAVRVQPIAKARPGGQQATPRPAEASGNATTASQQPTPRRQSQPPQLPPQSTASKTTQASSPSRATEATASETPAQGSEPLRAQPAGKPATVFRRPENLAASSTSSTGSASSTSSTGSMPGPKSTATTPAMTTRSNAEATDTPAAAGATGTSTTVTDAFAAPVALGPVGRTIADQAFPVPQTFLHAIQTLVTDFRFRRFVTPWIVKILWAICVAFAVLELLTAFYVLIIQPSGPAPGPRTSQGGWEFRPLQDLSLFQLRIMIFFAWTALIIFSLVITRMVAELILVFFRASGDLAATRKIIKEGFDATRQ